MLKVLLGVLKGIRIVITVILFAPVSIVALLYQIGEGDFDPYSDMPDWFIKSFMFCAGIKHEKE